MFFVILLLLFTVIPAIEIGLFVMIGGEIGPIATVAVVLFTGIAGASLARLQGFSVLRQIQTTIGQGSLPTDELVEGAIVLFGGALLLTPGFLTDAFGLSCLLPITRKGYAMLLRRWAGRRVRTVGSGQSEFGGFRMWTGGVRPGPAARDPEPSRTQGGFAPPPKGPSPTIDASFSVLDDDDDSGGR